MRANYLAVRRALQLPPDAVTAIERSGANYPVSYLCAFGGAEGIGMAGFLNLDELFKGRHFDRDVVVLCVRWYLRFKLTYRDLVEIVAERGLSMVHTTIMRWVHHYAPEFERRWNRFTRPAGNSWRVDETYVKVCGEWVLPGAMAEPG